MLTGPSIVPKSIVQFDKSQLPSWEKMEAMKISKKPRPLNMLIGNTKVNQNLKFEYLGSIFTENESLDKEIETR